jgi:hypothetical protein
MTPDEIGKMLAQAANRAFPQGEESNTTRVEAAILKDLRPVRPLAPAWMLTLALLALFAVFAAASALALGMYGLHVLSPPQRALIFSALLPTACLAAVACAREMSPAGGTRRGAIALIFASLLFPAVFALAFHGYGVRNLVKEGIPCLVAGLCVAIPAGLAVALILRRGFVLDWSAAGVAAGALSGLAGLGMLELHCANLKAIHVIVWHVAVVVASGAIGFVAGRVAAARGSGLRT